MLLEFKCHYQYKISFLIISKLIKYLILKLYVHTIFKLPSMSELLFAVGGLGSNILQLINTTKVLLKIKQKLNKKTLIIVDFYVLVTW